MAIDRDDFERAYCDDALRVGGPHRNPADLKRDRTGHTYGELAYLSGAWKGWQLAMATVAAREVKHD